MDSQLIIDYLPLTVPNALTITTRTLIIISRRLAARGIQNEY
jgi:hypothetical protein